MLYQEYENGMLVTKHTVICLLTEDGKVIDIHNEMQGSEELYSYKIDRILPDENKDKQWVLYLVKIIDSQEINIEDLD